VPTLDHRTVARFPAHVHARWGDGTEGTLSNISTAGGFLQTPRRDAVGTLAELELRSPLTRNCLRTTARVVHHGVESSGLGLHFIDTPEIVRHELERYCGAFARPERVVMVDDEPAMLRMMSRVLESEKMALVGIDIPVHDAAMLARFTPTVIILDINMPVVDGPTLARRLRANASTADLPLLFYSATPEDIPRDLADVPCVAKGGDVSAVLAAVRRVKQNS
jgi:CheY-like chemotaxis protein